MTDHEVRAELAKAIEEKEAAEQGQANMVEEMIVLEQELSVREEELAAERANSARREEFLVNSNQQSERAETAYHELEETWLSLFEMMEDSIHQLEADLSQEQSERKELAVAYDELEQQYSETVTDVKNLVHSRSSEHRMKLRTSLAEFLAYYRSTLLSVTEWRSNMTAHRSEATRDAVWASQDLFWANALKGLEERLETDERAHHKALSECSAGWATKCSAMEVAWNGRYETLQMHLFELEAEVDGTKSRLEIAHRVANADKEFRAMKQETDAMLAEKASALQAMLEMPVAAPLSPRLEAEAAMSEPRKVCGWL